MATHCAEDQGKFWEMRDRLFEHQDALEPFGAHAEAIGLNLAAFEECMNSNRHAEAIRRDMAEAGKAGVSGTPSFVIARIDPANSATAKGISFLQGALPFEDFKAAIEAALSESRQ